MKNATLQINGCAVPLIATNTIIVGAGAAGMNAAVRLVEFWSHRGVTDPAERLAVVTRGLPLGASRMSGSDKQTYYKMGSSPITPDTAVDFAKTLTAGGCCHGDTALIEGVCSLRGFYNLVEAGVPFPHDPLGAFIGYKTDHDPYERATSAGPKTSRFMSECLEARARRYGVPILDGFEVVRFVRRDGSCRTGVPPVVSDTHGQDARATHGRDARATSEDGRIIAMIAIDRGRIDEPAFGLTVFVAENWVLAAGGPGEIYETTVYPRGQIGLHAPALEAGLEAVNLTESQYGLASTKFRWNVSGTYMQVVPRIFSTDAKGRDEREFLTEYFESTAEMAGNIFLKGYQWPFDASRIAGRKSSLIDMAVHQETVVRGRRVWMDFLRNPVGAPGWKTFAIADLPAEAREYLEKAAAVQATPIDRLEHMNRPAIDIYAENGIDLTREPLEIAVCAQHNNGGFAVDAWWQSSVPGVFVIGEMAGTHGVKRPGGSALNAGQTGGLRAAEYIAHARPAEIPDFGWHSRAQRSGACGCAPDHAAKPPTVAPRTSRQRLSVPPAAEALREEIAAAIRATMDDLSRPPADDAQTPAEALAELRQRMTRHAAHLRSVRSIDGALLDALGQYRRIVSGGLRTVSRREVIDALHARQQCLTHVAMLTAVREMIARGAGSRGSHCILDDAGEPMHPNLRDETGTPYRVKPENVSLRDHILRLRYNPDAEGLFECFDERPRPIPHRDVAFETAWRDYREGKIYE